MTDADEPSKYGDLSPAWQRKFEIFDSVSADREFNYFSWRWPEEFKSLSYGDRMRIGLNTPAFLLGIFFYLFKGMWLKGVVILAGSCLVTTLIVLLDFAIDAAFPWFVYWAPFASFYGSLANFDLGLITRG